MSSIEYDSQEQFLYFEDLHDFFKIKKNADTVVNILTGKSDITLRLIEWFLKRYSKNHNVCYLLPHPIKNNPPIMTNIHRYYMETSKLFSDKRFGIFCRRIRISVPMGPENEYQTETNIAQLNFFKWVISNRVIEYMENNYSSISYDMYSHSTARNKNTNRRGPKTSRRSRLIGGETTGDTITAKKLPNKMKIISTIPITSSINSNELVTVI